MYSKLLGNFNLVVASFMALIMTQVRPRNHETLPTLLKVDAWRRKDGTVRHTQSEQARAVNFVLSGSDTVIGRNSTGADE